MQYKYAFDTQSMHIGVAKRQSGSFDIYQDGNFVDTPVDYKKRPVTCKDFTVSYDKIYFTMHDRDTPDRYKTLLKG